MTTTSGAGGVSAEPRPLTKVARHSRTIWQAVVGQRLARVYSLVLFRGHPFPSPSREIIISLWVAKQKHVLPISLSPPPRCSQLLAKACVASPTALPTSSSSASNRLPLSTAFRPTSGGGLKELRADLPSGDFHGFVEKFKGECRGGLGWFRYTFPRIILFCLDGWVAHGRWWLIGVCGWVALNSSRPA